MTVNQYLVLDHECINQIDRLVAIVIEGGQMAHITCWSDITLILCFIMATGSREFVVWREGERGGGGGERERERGEREGKGKEGRGEMEGGGREMEGEKDEGREREGENRC